jgi:hypothetical protein
MNETVWSNEASFKLSGIRNSHFFLYWCPESQRIYGGEKAANIPNGVSSRDFIGPIFLRHSYRRCELRILNVPASRIYY